MPQQKAAFKSMRQTVKRTERNRLVKKKIKELRKKADKLIGEKKADEANKIYLQLQKMLDKASRSGHFVNTNTARRYKSRLKQKINAIKA